MKKYKLKQTKQCKTCPWRAGATVADIPNYSIEQHQSLRNTIAIDGDISGIGRYYKIHKMACHQPTNNDEPYECVGWLHNQLGIGNNIPLRISMAHCENAKDIQVTGQQKKHFEETFS
ncbi:MAG: DUF6283 family protein [Oscillatoriaceae cyanobacterium Prado104]|jgi:hypothetical protein|nr:DUF6283 family protein [Oscillatoriaceae cyanobacterium Prado104]